MYPYYFSEIEMNSNCVEITFYINEFIYSFEGEYSYLVFHTSNAGSQLGWAKAKGLNSRLPHMGGRDYSTWAITAAPQGLH